MMWKWVSVLVYTWATVAHALPVIHDTTIPAEGLFRVVTFHAKRRPSPVLVAGPLVGFDDPDFLTSNGPFSPAGLNDGFIYRTSAAGEYPPTGNGSPYFVADTGAAQSCAERLYNAQYLNYGVYNAEVIWNTSSLGAGASISSANFISYVSSLNNADSLFVTGDWVSPATITTADWTNTAGATAFTLPLSSVNLNATNTIALGGFNNTPGINLTGNTELRVNISCLGGNCFTPPTGLNIFCFETMETLPSHQIPDLQVVIGPPPPTSTPTTTFTAIATNTPLTTPTPRPAPTCATPGCTPVWCEFVP